MAPKEYTGGAVETTITGGTLAAGALSIPIASATGWPTGTGTKDFVAIIDPDSATEEKVLCSARSGTTLTVSQRGYDGTTDQSHANGTAIIHGYDAVSAQEANDHTNDTTRDDHTQYLDPTRHDAHDHTTAVGTAVLADLSDVGATAPTTGQALVYDGAAWIPGDVETLVGCYAYATSSLAVPDATLTNVPLHAEQWDTHGFHTGSSHLLTIPAGLDGTYRVSGRVVFRYTVGADPSYMTLMQIVLDRAAGTDEVLEAASGSVDPTYYTMASSHQATMFCEMVAGDSVYMKIFNRNIGTAGARPTVGFLYPVHDVFLCVERIGDTV